MVAAGVDFRVCPRIRGQVTGVCNYNRVFFSCAALELTEELHFHSNAASMLPILLLLSPEINQPQGVAELKDRWRR